MSTTVRSEDNAYEITRLSWKIDRKPMNVPGPDSRLPRGGSSLVTIHVPSFFNHKRDIARLRLTTSDIHKPFGTPSVVSWIGQVPR